MIDRMHLSLLNQLLHRVLTLLPYLLQFLLKFLLTRTFHLTRLVHVLCPNGIHLICQLVCSPGFGVLWRKLNPQYACLASRTIFGLNRFLHTIDLF
ncbi:hypothetical protein D3C75_1150840 [compost metagenome]